jgi:hypothetical protein
MKVRLAFIWIFVLTCSWSATAADVFFPLHDFRSLPPTNRNALITPVGLLPGTAFLTVQDKWMYQTGTNGSFWVSNMVPGSYVLTVMGPPTTSFFPFFVDPTNQTQNAAANVITSTNLAWPPNGFAWTAQASDARYGAGSTGLLSLSWGGYVALSSNLVQTVTLVTNVAYLATGAGSSFANGLFLPAASNGSVYTNTAATTLSSNPYEQWYFAPPSGVWAYSSRSASSTPPTGAGQFTVDMGVSPAPVLTISNIVSSVTNTIYLPLLQIVSPAGLGASAFYGQLIFPPGAQFGYVLTSDTNGAGSWQAPAAGVGGANLFALQTNFLTRNVVFVDAANGADTNPGTANLPWATIGHAQQNTPAGLTIAVAPGSYADIFTNTALNVWLADGATISVTYVSAGTNSIEGSGNVILSASGSWSGGTSATVYCRNLTCDGANQIGGTMEVHCVNATNIILLGANSSTLIIHCEHFSGSMATGTGLASLKLYATEDATMIAQWILGSSSVVSTPLLFTGGNTFSTGPGFTYAVGGTYCSGVDPLFPAHMMFLGDPYFDHAPTAPSAVGTIQY